MHFEREPLALERSIPGLRSLGSGFASVRADDGLCRRHERYVSSHASCAGYEPLLRAPSQSGLAVPASAASASSRGSRWCGR